MDTQSLIKILDPLELTFAAPALHVWEVNAVSNAEDVARYMYNGGAFPPQASGHISIPKDCRPQKKYWYFVKKEMHAFLCTDEGRYRELWKRIDDLESKTTTIIVGVIATFLGEYIGASATILSGFVAICLYAIIKIGKEAYCGYIAQK